VARGGSGCEAIASFEKCNGSSDLTSVAPFIIGVCSDRCEAFARGNGLVVDLKALVASGRVVLDAKVKVPASVAGRKSRSERMKALPSLGGSGPRPSMSISSLRPFWMIAGVREAEGDAEFSSSCSSSRSA